MTQVESVPRRRNADGRIGALVVSLDFELIWGMRDVCYPGHPYLGNVLGARDAVSAMLDLFCEYDIRATWATVGFLFASHRFQIEDNAPTVRPLYEDVSLDPYNERVGIDEVADPLRFGGSLVRTILDAPGQEIGTHTFSHYYCLEAGQTREAFDADLESAVKMARLLGTDVQSIVFPRNQHNPEYDKTLRKHGIIAYRLNQAGYVHRPRRHANQSLLIRALRWLDSVVPIYGSGTVQWSDMPANDGLVGIPATMFLRPTFPGDRLAGVRASSIKASIKRAAERREVVHLWWHPHNFGSHLNSNLTFLRDILETFAQCRSKFGCQSMTMREAASERLGM
jgi:peptidoglycan/xylan/chitin deacetylase (PgdA/CDA1 family)